MYKVILDDIIKDGYINYKYFGILIIFVIGFLNLRVGVFIILIFLFLVYWENFCVINENFFFLENKKIRLYNLIYICLLIVVNKILLILNWII